MFPLNLSLTNLSTIRNSVSLFLCLLLFSCSSTEQTNNHYSNDNYFNGNYFNGKVYDQRFANEDFYHNQFTPTNTKTIKKPLQSDHHLIMSLLNRPITADQAMMLAFAQERKSYHSSNSNYAIVIKGEKSSDEPNSRSEQAYAQLISQDINAVNISAPK